MTLQTDEFPATFVIRNARMLLPDGNLMQGEVKLQGSQIIEVAPEVSQPASD